MPLYQKHVEKYRQRLQDEVKALQQQLLEAQEAQTQVGVKAQEVKDLQAALEEEKEQLLKVTSGNSTLPTETRSVKRTKVVDGVMAQRNLVGREKEEERKELVNEVSTRGHTRIVA